MQSLETMSLWSTYKVKYPENFLLCRGNHEGASTERICGFYDEFNRGYDVTRWKQLCDVSSYFTLCGLSPGISTMEQVRCLRRPLDGTDTGIIYDWLWADLAKNITGWAENDCGVSDTNTCQF